MNFDPTRTATKFHNLVQKYAVEAEESLSQDLVLSSLAEFKPCWPSLSDKHTELTVKNGMPAEASASVTHARNGISACVKAPPLFFMSGYGPVKHSVYRMIFTLM